MSNLGYVPPHSCKYCHTLTLDFTKREPWNTLRPLHQTMTNWGPEQLAGVPYWMIPAASNKIASSIRSSKSSISRKATSLFAKVTTSNDKYRDLNDIYKSSLSADPRLKDIAQTNLRDLTFFRVDRDEYMKQIGPNCLLLRLLLEYPRKEMLHAEGSKIIVGAKRSLGTIIFGIPYFALVCNMNIIELDPIMSFETILPRGRGVQSFKKNPINIDLKSNESLSTICTWFETCRRDHEMCRLVGRNFIPTRLLEIFYKNGQRMLRLTPGSRLESIEYAAVSYRWGFKQKVITTSRNINQRMIGIDFNLLPATFQDAIVVTETLGLRFLWIDALCIIQESDDPEMEKDKDQEIRQMANIFENATITIIASRAKTANDGFLQNRLPAGAGTPDQVFQMSYNDDIYGKQSVVLVPSKPVENEPLDSRAWPLQERLLSRRIINFGSLQTRWVCRNSTRGASIGDVDGWDSSLIWDSEGSFDLYRRFQDFRQTSASQAGDEIWHQIVAAYSSRQITERADRLPAIAAIAQQFIKNYGPEYLAGLWPSQLPLELLWRSNFEKLESRAENNNIGPSWSWVSLNRPVSYKSHWIAVDDDTRVFDPPDTDDAFQVLNFEVHPKSSEFSFGEISHAKLSIMARYRLANWTPGEQNDKSTQFRTLKRADNGASLPVLFRADCHSPALISKSGTQSITVVHMIIITTLPDFTFAMRDGYSTSAQLPAEPGAEQNDNRKPFVNIPLNEMEPQRKPNSYPITRPVGSIQGLVLLETSSHQFSRLGMFEVDYHHSEKYIPDVALPWNDRFKGYHNETKWFMEGDIQSFTII